jgi:hypothetical protein
MFMHTKDTLRAIFACTAAAATLLVGSQALADGSVSGKNSAAAAITDQTPLLNWPFDPLNETLLTATIERGKKRRMLLIQASLDYNGLDATLLGIAVTVNARGVEGSRSVMYCTNQVCDTVSGSWWLDLDAAEAQYPGEFIQKPLLVRLIGGEITGGGTVSLDDGVWNASLSVQMTKK